MIRVGLIGLGMMGAVHLDAYRRRSDARVVAVADRNKARLRGDEDVASNLGVGDGSSLLDDVATYSDGKQLINDAEVDVVDICVPTPGHHELAAHALRAGRHVLLEKPVSRTHEEGLDLIEVASGASGIIMPAMCMRFWPGWEWLKQTIDSRRYGRVLSAFFQRLSPHPGGPFYSDSEASGGAALDLHIHDSDFIRHCFGSPSSVSSLAHSNPSNELDYISTQYHYPDGPAVVAEGGWSLVAGHPFMMRYRVDFEGANADYDFGRSDPLLVTTQGCRDPIPLDPGTGYDHEIDYFLRCVRSSVSPEVVTLRDGVAAVRLVEFEVASAHCGRHIAVDDLLTGGSLAVATQTR